MPEKSSDNPDSNFKTISDDDVAKLIPSAMKKEIVQKKYLNKRQQEAIDAHKKFLEKHAVGLGTVADAVNNDSGDQEAIKDRLLAEELMNKQKFANMREVAKYQFFGKPLQTVGALTTGIRGDRTTLNPAS